MSFVQNTLIKLSLAMLALVSAAFFLVPAQKEAQAQVDNFARFCFNASNKDFRVPSSTNTCDPGYVIKSVLRAGLGYCVFTRSGVNVAEQPVIKADNTPQLNAAGTKCITDAGADYADFRRFSTITTRTGGGTTTPPTNSPTNSPTNRPTNRPPTNTTSTTPPPTGGCETGFHKVGPLCVPNSPFNNGESISGTKTVGQLAASIVKILLYFAGIVAVIMAIIGGYYIMTAAGNEAQATNGRKTLTNAIIGLVIVVLSYVIIQAVISFVT